MPPSYFRAHLKEAAFPRAYGQGTQPTGAFPRERGWGGAPPHVETPQASTAVGELGMFTASLVMSNEPGPMFSPWEEAHFTSGGGLGCH